ncbi:MAG: hypothetical protein H6Q58_1452 [Firmicutes bacterium]|nr:hypothetical protein [Bacillota bacterium]
MKKIGYKLFWVFVVFSVIGFVLECIAYSMEYGEIVIFKGLLYGPFSQIYGFGAVIMVVYSRIFKSRGAIFMYLSAAIIGSFYEFLCSMLQETLFGFVSWQYYDKALNIDGRTTLYLSVVWGLFGLFIVRYAYPFICSSVESLPKRLGRVVTWIFIILMSVNLFITFAAFSRQSERHVGVPPSNRLEAFIDKEYPDEFMKAIKPGLQFK